MPPPETLTTSEVQRLLKLGSPNATRTQLRRWGIDAVGRTTDTGEKTWPADEIHQKNATRPGRGNHTRNPERR